MYPVLSVEQIKDILDSNTDSNWIIQLCLSHEQLRQERNDLIAKCRKLLLEKVTVRETPEIVE